MQHARQFAPVAQGVAEGHAQLGCVDRKVYAIRRERSRPLACHLTMPHRPLGQAAAQAAAVALYSQTTPL